MKPKVVLTHRVHPDVIKYLSINCDVIPNDSIDSLTQREIIQRAKQAQAIMSFLPDSMDDVFLSQLPELKIVSCALKGYDNFDVEACTRRGIWFSIVPDLMAAPTAELAIGLLLGITRHILQGDDFIRSGEFQGWRPMLYGQSLQGKTAGIIGMGRIGKAIAKRLSGFDMQLLYCDPKPLCQQSEIQLGITRTSLSELLAKSHYILPAVPFKTNTFHLINEKSLTKIQPNAFIINVCRGSVVDESAVADALSRNTLAGYAADVFEMEEWVRNHRPTGIPRELIEQKNKTLFTPHLGSSVSNIRYHIEMTAAKNILQALNGQKPDNAINSPPPARRAVQQPLSVIPD